MSTFHRVNNQTEFEALKSLPRPSTFALMFESEEEQGPWEGQALLSAQGEVWVEFEHGLLFRVDSYAQLLSDDIPHYEDITVELLAKLFGVAEG